VLAALVIVATAGRGVGQTFAEIEAGFRQPPASARPQTLWFWMNGNVTRDGITRDLEAMKRVGIAGAIMFDGGTYQPAGPVGYMEPEWRALFGHAVREAARLGLEIGMHNGPGWSSTGGPWITPEHSMKQLVWTETTVRGGGAVDIVLPQPHTHLGFYRDARVLAFPALPGEEVAYHEQIRAVTTSSGRVVDPRSLSDGLLADETAITSSDFLLIEFAKPFEAQALTASPKQGERLSALRLEASDDGVQFKEVCTFSGPSMHGLQAPAARTFAPVRARFFRLIPRNRASLAEFVLHATPRIEDWIFKADFTYRLGRQVAIPEAGDRALAVDPAAVVDLTSKVDSSGRLRWDAPPGAWTVLRLGCTSIGMLNTSASAAGTGLECDKLSREGADAHFAHVQARLIEDLGPLVGRSFTAVTIDSYEAGMQNWTESFPEEFRRRAGYDIEPYLAAMTGRIVGDAASTERFLFDVRCVLRDMMTDNYYGRWAELCRQHGLKFYVEGYGQAMFDELEVSGLPQFPMTEFWTRTPWTPNRVAKMVASAAHVHGKPVVAAEAFTGEEYTSRWLDYPYSLKALGDDMFALGVNQFIFHRYAHQPHPDAVPGMAMGPWGFHFDRTNTWFDQSSGWLDYLSRSQFLLRQGTYVADVLYFVGERPPDVAQMAMPVLPAGHNYDLVNAEVLLTRASVKDGCIVLPEGGRYRLLMLPPNLKGATPELMRRLREMVGQGATVLGPKPQYSLTLRGFPGSDAEVRQIADELWSGRTGAGRVFSEKPVGEVLRELGATPDFRFTGQAPDAALSWLHRALPDGDIYFVANRQRRVDEVVCSFRVGGRQPEIWNPETGEVKMLAVCAEEDGRTLVPLRLEASGSVFVVFRKPIASSPVRWAAKNGERVVDVALSAPTPKTSPENTFTMALWAKPDTELRVMPAESTTGFIDETGKFYAIAAGEGDKLYGPGHAAAGVAVGRNGIFVVERTSTSAPAVLVASMPVAGWTHVAVVYRDGRPSLFMDGKFVREGLLSGAIVHPGIGSPPPAPETTFHFTGLENLLRASGLPSSPSQGRAFYHEGNQTRPELFDRALSGEEIAALAARNLPAPDDTAAVELTARADGSTEAVVWKSGTFTLDGGRSLAATVAAPLAVDGPWTVAFQAGRGAPATINLPALSSLHRHSDPGVKYFSGNATYTRTIDVPAAFLGEGKRVVLDLGRVEVLARVRVNGQPAALLWKEPFRADITGLAHPGANELEVTVTNLWANRLIGDEQLPPENEYRTDGEHAILRLPEWYTQGKPKPPGGRHTFTTWKFYSKDEPLLESGLLGPVRLLNPVVRVIER
jgi:hypothetical protein